MTAATPLTCYQSGGWIGIFGNGTWLLTNAAGNDSIVDQSRALIRTGAELHQLVAMFTARTDIMYALVGSMGDVTQAVVRGPVRAELVTPVETVVLTGSPAGGDWAGHMVSDPILSVTLAASVESAVIAAAITPPAVIAPAVIPPAVVAPAVIEPATAAPATVEPAAAPLVRDIEASAPPASTPVFGAPGGDLAHLDESTTLLPFVPPTQRGSAISDATQAISPPGLRSDRPSQPPLSSGPPPRPITPPPPLPAPITPPRPITAPQPPAEAPPLPSVFPPPPLPPLPEPITPPRPPAAPPFLPPAGPTAPLPAPPVAQPPIAPLPTVTPVGTPDPVPPVIPPPPLPAPRLPEQPPTAPQLPLPAAPVHHRPGAGLISDVSWAADLAGSGTVAQTPRPVPEPARPPAMVSEPPRSAPTPQNLDITIWRPIAESSVITGGGLTVAAVRCVDGHLNPLIATSCRICIKSIPPQGSVIVSRPPLGMLRMSTSDNIRLDHGVIFGRDPGSPDGNQRDQPYFVMLADKDISRRHLEVILDGWDVIVVDLHSSNGSAITMPGGVPEVIPGGARRQLVPGTVVHLSDTISFVYEVTP